MACPGHTTNPSPRYSVWEQFVSKQLMLGSAAVLPQPLSPTNTGFRVVLLGLC